MNHLEAKKTNRRRHLRVPVQGRARIHFNGQTVLSELKNASSRGAQILINSDRLALKPNDCVVIQPLIGSRSMAFICEVRHISIQTDEINNTIGFCIGLEHASIENNLDLLSLLVNTGVAKLMSQPAKSEWTEAICKNSFTLNLLREGIRQSSLRRILSPDQDPPSIEEISETESQPDFSEIWNASISIRSKAMNIEFSTHYEVDEARRFMESRKALKKFKMEDRLIHDFMREFCNLTAGAVKIWIGNHAGAYLSVEDLRVQLPIQGTKGQVDSHGWVASANNYAIQVRDEWQLNLSTGASLRCTADITVWDWSAVSSMDPDSETHEFHSEPIEFL